MLASNSVYLRLFISIIFMQTTTGFPNWLKGIFHGIGFFLLMGSATLIGLVPANIASMSVGAVITFLVGWAGHWLSAQ